MTADILDTGEIRVAIRVVREAIEAIANNDDLEIREAAQLLLELQGRSGDDMDKGVLGDVLDLKQWTTDWLARHVDRNEQTVEGVGHLDIKGGGPKSKRFDNEALVSKAAAAMADDAFTGYDPDTGEIVPVPPGVAAQAICETMAALTGATAPSFNSWRSGVAKTLGIDLRSYETDRSSERTPLSIIIR